MRAAQPTVAAVCWWLQAAPTGKFHTSLCGGCKLHPPASSVHPMLWGRLPPHTGILGCGLAVPTDSPHPAAQVSNPSSRKKANLA